MTKWFFAGTAVLYLMVSFRHHPGTDSERSCFYIAIICALLAIATK